jgi:3-oxoadipate enol-lactonase
VLDRLEAITVPTLALAGTQDVSTVPAAMRQTADGLPDCEYVELDPGTHMMTMEQPEAVADALLAFRERVAGAG